MGAETRFQNKCKPCDPIRMCRKILAALTSVNFETAINYACDRYFELIYTQGNVNHCS